MKHPFWILNSALLFLLIAALLFIFFSRERIPSRQSIRPDESIEPITRAMPQISIEKIYENDLFDTYKKEFPPVTPPERLTPLPPPPEPQPVHIPEKPAAQFLDPLAITLRGITIFSNDDTKNRAIIEDTKTNTEKTYSVGSKIEDAQLLRIFSNKIVLIRSNGQQEVLYLREKDAQLDPAYAMITGWDDVIQKNDTNSYTIYPSSFIERIPTLGQFIDLLNMVTVYKQGQSVGCKIGPLEENSLGLALGLQKGDIVTQINNIPATDTAQRFAIYKAITNMKPNDVIEAKVLRNNQIIDLKYTLVDPKEKPKPLVTTTKSTESLEQEQIKVMEEKYRFAPTVQEIRNREKENMRKRGAPPSFIP